MIRINKPKQAPENLIIDGKKRCISHCIAYSDNLKNPKNQGSDNYIKKIPPAFAGRIFNQSEGCESFFTLKS